MGSTTETDEGRTVIAKLNGAAGGGFGRAHSWDRRESGNLRQRRGSNRKVASLPPSERRSRGAGSDGRNFPPRRVELTSRRVSAGASEVNLRGLVAAIHFRGKFLRTFLRHFGVFFEALPGTRAVKSDFRYSAVSINKYRGSVRVLSIEKQPFEIDESRVLSPVRLPFRHTGGNQASRASCATGRGQLPPDYPRASRPQVSPSQPSHAPNRTDSMAATVVIPSTVDRLRK